MPAVSARSASGPFRLLAALPLLAGGPELAQDYRLDGRAEPLSQAVRLAVDPVRADYSGTTVIDLRVRRATDALLFHAEDMEIDRVELRRLDSGGDSEAGSGGTWTLEPEVGAWGTVAARADETLIPYQLTLEVPSGLEALTNTPIARRSEADGTRTVVFEPTPPTPSYLLPLAVGPLESVEIPGLSVPGRVVTPAGRRGLTELAVEMTPPILAALEGYFGRPYPYAKLDLVAVPEFWQGAMENPGADDPAVAGTALQIAARDGDEALFETLRERFETADNPTDRQRFLRALGAFETPELRRRALEYALEGPVRPNEIFTIPFGQRVTEEDRDRVFRWTVGHFDDLAERVPPMILDFLPRMAGGCSPERLRAAEEFFTADSRRTESLAKTLAKVRDQVHACVALREREGAAVRRYLTSEG